jgi:two-component system CheB/CheR fusion protein
MTDRISDERQPDRRESVHGRPSMVVGLGASAGGIRALSEFFSNVPQETSVAYVVILHLSPDHDSKLAEVLQASARMPVTQVRETVTLERNHVYVIPPNQTLEVSGTTLRVVPMTRPEERRAPVDMFFRTLADAYGAHAAAVVLSGTGPNGSNGLKRVKENGGLTVAQVPTEAEYDDMPRNAIATGLVDYVLPVAAIPLRILDYHQRLRDRAVALGDPPADGSADGISPPELRSAQSWRDILTLLRVRTRHDFSNYKPTTLRRRVERRLNVRGLTALSEYAQLLREDSGEPLALMRELLISVTNFFRDPEAWRVLEQRVVPLLFRDKQAADHVRVWSAGCATGEEAYSLALILAEHAANLANGPSIQVFATDLDEQAIARAREGLYTEADVSDVAPERLQRFFQREAGGYRVRREVRELVLFAEHNLISDPPFSHLDLISCRNLLIYLNRTVQERLIERFHFALRPGGCLFLGTSESAGGNSDLFFVLDKAAHIFESRIGRTRPSLMHTEYDVPVVPAVPQTPELRPGLERISAGDLHLRLLEQYGPPSLVVNEQHVLLHASGQASRFLHVPPGEPTRDLVQLVLPDLRSDLRTALHLASQQRSITEVGGVHVTTRQGDEVVKIVVKPVLRGDGTLRGYFLVLFEDDSDAAVRAEPSTRLPSGIALESEHLEGQLVRVKGQLRATIEQYETHAEESRAATEELQAMNEELRSSAEELETSKEELQSVNEELSTVNQELKIKIEELGLTNDDFRNLINSTDIGTIFLDRLLRVKMSTPAAQKIFNLLPGDIGRKLSDITSRLADDRLHEDMSQVLEKLQTVEREVHTHDQQYYLMRILPYRTIDDRIEGVSVTFHDITDRHNAEVRVHASEERLRLLIDSAVDYAIITMRADGHIDSWSPGAERMFGYAADEIIGKDAAILFTPEDRAAGIPQQELVRTAESGRANDERWHLRKDGGRLYCSGVMTRFGDGDSRAFVKIARDLTAHREAELDLQNAHAELEDRVRQRTGELQAEVSKHASARRDVTSLLRRIVTAQEDERARVARDLHDQLGQQLTALRMALERYRDQNAPADRADELERALALTREIDAELDFLAWELRPTALDDLGLAAALPHYLEQWSAHYGLVSKYQTAGQLDGALSREAEVAFYRIAQEALTNVIKHAHASRVDVLLERRGSFVVLVVEDDGLGFDAATPRVQQTGLGLAGMRERAGLIGADLQIESTPGKGTSVYVRYPVQRAESAEGAEA